MDYCKVKCMGLKPPPAWACVQMYSFRRLPTCPVEKK